MKRTGSRPSALPAAPSPAASAPPYPPSWINRFVDRIERLPGPAWASYFLAAVVLALIQWALQSAAGRAVNGFNLLVAATVPYELGLMHYLIRTSAGALDEFQPALRATKTEAEALRFRLTTLPARPVLLAGLTVSLASAALILASYNIEPASVVLGAGGLQILSPSDAARIFQISPAPLSLAFTGLILVGSWWATATYAYLSLHQLRLINTIYTLHTEIRMFRLDPLYAFSRHTLRSSLGLLLLAYALFATARQVMQGGLGLGAWILLVSGAVATFLLPLLGIHRALVREKNRMLSETGARFEAGVAQLHDRMDDGRLQQMDDLNKALASLEIERAVLERVPTWPWERGTVRSLVAAILIPLLVWAVQAVLQRYLGG